MNPIVWLCAKAPGFSALSGAEREAIMQFSLLWSLFEDMALNNDAKISSIKKLVQRWDTDNQLNNPAFNEGHAYYSNRYFSEGIATAYFDGLRLGSEANMALVKTGLSDEAASPRESVTALFIVIYRLRNNLFHGEKWAYGLRGQLDNFTHANNCLMAAIDSNEVFS